MRVRASTILLFALLPAPVVNAAAMASAARNASKSREHPAASKPVKAAAISPVRVAHGAERVSSSHASSREVEKRSSVHSSGHLSDHFSRAEPIEKARGGRVVAAREERESKSRHEPERRQEIAEVREVRGSRRGESARAVSVRTASGKSARVEPEKTARLTPAPIVRVQPEETAPVSSEIESDPEAANVVHDRKVHHSPDGHSANDAEDEEEPRKATSEDFMSAAPAAKPAEAATLPSPVRPVAGVMKIKVAPIVKLAIVAPEPPPVTVPVLYRGGHLVVPPALKGSHEILVHQNEMADIDGLLRIRDDEDLDDMRANKLLVAIPAVQGIQVDERLPANRRYCRPWTAQFLTALARAHYARFHTALQVNSAVRTVEFQQRLMLTNGNAAPAEGETASPHLTGQAVDLAKHGLSMTEIAWLRGYLLPLVQEGKVDVEEEFQQSCFHVSVYRKYMPQAEPKRVIPPHHSATTALATVLR